VKPVQKFASADAGQARPPAGDSPHGNEIAFSELMDRKSVLLPTLFSVVFVVSLFLVAAAGQTRLVESNNQLREAEYRARRLSDFLRYMVDAETASRGYVITGEPGYLTPLNTSPPGAAAALADLNKAYADIPAARRDIETLKILSDTCLGLFDRWWSDAARASSLLRCSSAPMSASGPWTSCAKSWAPSPRKKGAGSIWRRRARTRIWSRVAGCSDWVALLNVLLVVLAGVLISLDLRRRVSLAGTLEDQRQVLERQVRERTQELAALSTHLQTVAEEERAALARNSMTNSAACSWQRGWTSHGCTGSCRRRTRHQAALAADPGWSRRRREPEAPGWSSSCAPPCSTTWDCTPPFAGNSRSRAGVPGSSAPNTIRSRRCASTMPPRLPCSAWRRKPSRIF